MTLPMIFFSHNSPPTHQQSFARLIKLGCSLFLVAVLSACGGGGGGSTTAGDNGNNPGNGATTTLSGVAADNTGVAAATTGNASPSFLTRIAALVRPAGDVASPALAKAKVTLRDANGKTAETTTDDNGKFTLNTSGLTPPFLLKVVLDNKTLYSTSTGTDTANITPLTNLIVKTYFQAQGTTAEAAMTSTTTKLPTPELVQAVVSTVASLLGTDADTLKKQFNASMDLTKADDTNANVMKHSTVKPDGTVQVGDGSTKTTSKKLAATDGKLQATTKVGDTELVETGVVLGSDDTAILSGINAALAKVTKILPNTAADYTSNLATIKTVVHSKFLHSGVTVDKFFTDDSSGFTVKWSLSSLSEKTGSGAEMLVQAQFDCTLTKADGKTETYRPCFGNRPMQFKQENGVWKFYGDQQIFFAAVQAQTLTTYDNGLAKSTRLLTSVWVDSDSAQTGDSYTVVQSTNKKPDSLFATPTALSSGGNNGNSRSFYWYQSSDARPLNLDATYTITRMRGGQKAEVTVRVTPAKTLLTLKDLPTQNPAGSVLTITPEFAGATLISRAEWDISCGFVKKNSGYLSTFPTSMDLSNCKKGDAVNILIRVQFQDGSQTLAQLQWTGGGTTGGAGGGTTGTTDGTGGGTTGGTGGGTTGVDSTETFSLKNVWSALTLPPNTILKISGTLTTSAYTASINGTATLSAAIHGGAEFEGGSHSYTQQDRTFYFTITVNGQDQVVNQSTSACPVSQLGKVIEECAPSPSTKNFYDDEGNPLGGIDSDGKYTVYTGCALPATAKVGDVLSCRETTYSDSSKASRLSTTRSTLTLQKSAADTSGIATITGRKTTTCVANNNVRTSETTAKITSAGEITLIKETSTGKRCDTDAIEDFTITY